MIKISYGKQCVDDGDIKEVVKVLRSDWLTQGPKVEEFETKFAKFCGAKYAVVCSSGTAALHLAYLVAGLKKGDEIITSPITFLATANAALFVGAKPVFADIQEDTVNIAPDEIERKITRKTKAIVPVHFAGYPCDLEEIHQIAKRHNLFDIEDACHALGAEYKIREKWFKVGSCSHSIMTVFSFHPVKHITTGEGGAITTNSRILYERLKCLRNHGMVKNKTTAKKGQWYYEMRLLGYNYRITDFQCALGLSQLKKLPNFIKQRMEIAKRYNENLKDLKKFVKLPIERENKKHAWHLYALKINFEKLKISRKQLFLELNAAGIFPQVHYIPIYKQPYYRRKMSVKLYLKNAEEYYRKCLSLPIFPSLNEKTQDYVIKTFRKIILKNAK